MCELNITWQNQVLRIKLKKSFQINKNYFNPKNIVQYGLLFFTEVTTVLWFRFQMDNSKILTKYSLYELWSEKFPPNIKWLPARLQQVSVEIQQIVVQHGILGQRRGDLTCPAKLNKKYRYGTGTNQWIHPPNPVHVET
jgi:hypothetical protein